MMDIIRDILFNTITHIAIWIFPLFALSLAMSRVSGWLQKIISRAVGFRAYMLLLGWPGTLVHELSHALAGLVFGHKIESFNVHLLGGQDGKAGSVRLNHNPESYYQRSGNFFIAMAPIFGCAAIIYLAAVFLASGLLTTPAVTSTNAGHWANELYSYATTSSQTLILLCKNQLTSTVLFLYITASIGSGMRMSLTDMKKTVPGCFILAGLFLLFYFLHYFIGEEIVIPAAIFEALRYIYTIMIATMVINLILTALFFIIVKIRSIF
jgi:hypothetical protein